MPLKPQSLLLSPVFIEMLCLQRDSDILSQMGSNVRVFLNNRTIIALFATFQPIIRTLLPIWEKITEEACILRTQ